MSYWLPAAILAYMPSIESKLDSMILTPYSSWKPLSTLGVEVVGPVEVDEVAVDLGLGGLRQRGLGRASSSLDVGAAGRGRRRRRAARPPVQEGCAGWSTRDGCGHARAPVNEAGPGVGSGPSWPTRMPTVAASVARASSRVEVGVVGQHPGAEAVAERDRRLARPCGVGSAVAKSPVAMPVGDDRRPRWSRGPRRGRPRPWRAPASRRQSRASSCQSSHSCASCSSLGRHRSRKAESRCGGSVAGAAPAPAG